MTDYATPKQLKRQIKEKVQNFLKGKTAAEDRVFISRSIPTQYEEQDVILIHTTGESIERFDQAPKSYKRNLTLLIECVSTGDTDSDLDLQLEEMGEIVEDWLEQDETLDGLVNKVELVGTDYQYEPEAQNPMGLLALRFDVEFYTFPAPDPTKLNVLRQTDIDWKIGHHDAEADDVIDAEDELVIDE